MADLTSVCLDDFIDTLDSIPELEIDAVPAFETLENFLFTDSELGEASTGDSMVNGASLSDTLSTNDSASDGTSSGAFASSSAIAIVGKSRSNSGEQDVPESGITMSSTVDGFPDLGIALAPASPLLQELTSVASDSLLAAIIPYTSDPVSISSTTSPARVSGSSSWAHASANSMSAASFSSASAPLNPTDNDIGVGLVSRSPSVRKKPSFAVLCATALISSTQGKMNVCDIYEWAQRNYTWIQPDERMKWKSSIRNILSTHPGFVKSSSRNEHGYEWSIHEACMDAFVSGDIDDRTRARQQVLNHQQNTTSKYQKHGNRRTTPYVQHLQNNNQHDSINNNMFCNQSQQQQMAQQSQQYSQNGYGQHQALYYDNMPPAPYQTY